MRVAMPIWKDRISPVMDAATRLLIVEYDGHGEVTRTEEPISGEHPPQLARLLSGLGIGLLICGGISQHLFSLLEAQQITVYPWVTGPVEVVLDAYHTNRLGSRRFLMPGCAGRKRGWGRGRRQGARRGRGRGPGTSPNNIDRTEEMRE